MAEVAGLVLGAIPLVIQGLEIYLEGIKTVKRCWKYAGTVSNLAKTLATEKAIYRNNCILLLQDLVSDEELALLLKDPGGPLWREKDLEKKLTEALGDSFQPYITTLSSMNKVVESFKNKLGMENGTVKWSDRKKFKSEWKQVIVVLCLAETRTSLLEIRTHNVHMETLLGQQAKVKPSRAKEAARYAIFYANVQRHARILYQTIKNNFGRQCGCRNMHGMKLRLEARFKERGPPTASTSTAGLDFRVLFFLESPERRPLPWNWKETIIRPAPENITVRNFSRPGHNRLHSAMDLEINELCTKLCADQFPNLGADHIHLGVLVGGTRNETRLQMELTGISFDTEPSPVSLLELLSIDDSMQQQEESQREDFRRREFRREDRLVLGLKLASSTLQLSRTSWIGENWNSEDILFVKQRNGNTITMIQNPYLSGPFPPDGRNGQAGTGLFQLRNRTLFNLGIILLDLWFGRASEALRLSQGEDSRIAAAGKLLKQLRADEGIPGENYASAVEFCLSLDFGKSNSLDDASFQEEVWSNVVWPLQEYLKSFSGKEIDQLIL